MAHGANWTDVQISFNMATQINDIASSSLTTGAILTLVFLGIMVSLGIFGSVVELSKIGDVSDLDYPKLEKAARFETVKQHEPILLQRKKPWAAVAICFSPIRNFTRMSMHSKLYEQILVQNKDAKSAKSLRVFNGVRAMSSLYFMYGCTYFFSWYGIWDNPQDFMKMKNSVLFTIIPGALFIVPVILFTSGFLSTLSFLQTAEHELWSVVSVFGFYKNRVIKLIPFNLFALAFFVFVLPYIGTGPIWQNYNKTVQPCSDYWWTNALFINNFYPTEYE